MSRTLALLGLLVTCLCCSKTTSEIDSSDVSAEVKAACSGPISASRRSRLEVTKGEAILVAKEEWIERGIDTSLYEPIEATLVGGLWEVESPSTSVGLLRAQVCHRNARLLRSVALTELHERTPSTSGGFVSNADVATRVATVVWPSLFSHPMSAPKISRSDDSWVVEAGERLEIRADSGALSSPGVDSSMLTDETTAIALAEVLAVATFGKSVLKQRPFHIGNRDNVWLLESSFPLSLDAGGTAQLGLSKADGSVIWMFHTK